MGRCETVTGAHACLALVPYRQGTLALLQGKLQGKIHITCIPAPRQVAPQRQARAPVPMASAFPSSTTKKRPTNAPSPKQSAVLMRRTAAVTVVSPTTAHQNELVQVGWLKGGQFLDYNLPVQGRNLSGFDVLSVRAAQTDCPCNVDQNGSPVDVQDFEVELRSGSIAKSVRVSGYAAIPRPYPVRNWQRKHVMTTVQIPLSSFSNLVPIDNVESVRLKFDNPSQGELYLGDIEFSRSSGVAAPAPVPVPVASDRLILLSQLTDQRAAANQASSPIPRDTGEIKLASVRVRRLSEVERQQAGSRFLAAFREPYVIEVSTEKPLNYRGGNSAPAIILNGTRLNTFVIETNRLGANITDLSLIKDANTVSIEWPGRGRRTTTQSPLEFGRDKVER
jgi:hypothetical protein